MCSDKELYAWFKIKIESEIYGLFTKPVNKDVVTFLDAYYWVYTINRNNR